MVVLGSGRFSYEVSGENWGKLPEGWSYKEATSVDIDSKDTVYIFNRGQHPMIVLDSEGNFLRSWGEGMFTLPHGVTIGPDDTVYTADMGDHTIRRFTPKGKLLMTIGVPGKAPPPMSGKPFNKPCRVAIDPRNGDILVADGYSNARVHRFSPDGKILIASWGESGTDPGQFNLVHDIAIDRNGWIYIADRENRRIQVFTSDGKYETQWNNFTQTACIHIENTQEQLVYVGEYFGGIVHNNMAHRLGPRISILSLNGEVLQRLGDKPMGDEPGRFYTPHGIAADSKGNLYVAEVSWSLPGKDMKPPRELRSMQKLVRIPTGDTNE